MAQKRKDFTGGLNALISGIAPTAPAPAPQEQPARKEKKAPRAERPTPAPASTAAAEPGEKKRGRGRPRKEGTENEQRTTLILDADMLRQIKEISYRETGKEGKKVLIKDIIAEALQRYIDEYEQGR